jgi:fructose-1,6-bisphosphatase/inositol monophosphatase family enzyme
VARARARRFLAARPRRGALDAAVDTKLELWDSAAVELVVTEAGGRAAVAADGQFVTTNGRVHDEVLALLRDG